MTTETVLPEFQIDNLSAGIYGARADPARIDFARAIEQAVLQSPEIRALRKDAERYHEVRSRLTGQSYDPSFFDGLFMVGCMGHLDDLDEEVDAHMGK
ncbi:hypothetical protein ACSBPU_12985 [Parapusillimonas sp. JC17]|uniref:hypothetical protein n=1 Tax=Parapusillimonas sp. JC17 TaxID=3445768 RepID=UPI003F9F4912